MSAVCFCDPRGRTVDGGACPDCGGPGYVRADEADALAAQRDALREALRFVCCVTEGCEFCGAIGTKVRDGSEWCDVCAPPDAVDHEHAATLRPLLPPRGAK